VSATVPLRVVVADDEPLIQRGIVTVLEETGFEVVAVVGDADDLLRKTSAHKPDVVISDIQMPPGREDDGLRAAQQIRSAQPQVGVLILSQYLEAA
jgi:DNA-binding NarL/FixJ family response regulator